MAGLQGTGSCNETLDAWLGSTVLGPATVYAALFTTAPTAAGGGTEATFSGYARVAITNDLTNFPAAASRTKTTGTEIDFGTAGSSGGTMTWGAFVRTASGALGADDIIYAGPLSNARLVLNGDGPIKVPVGGVVITLT